ncbi:MAG: SLBB domain-containing protein [Tepidanaerobacteraceae bacterium]|nr:SLBB domain-containing protein [Tepidanaerobacteraceae bacterium]
MAERQEIIKAVELAGVVGAGGAGFPTHVKLAARCDVVIANAAECEPLLANNQELLKYSADAVIDGLNLAMEATGAQKGIVAIKKKYRESLAAIEKEIQKEPRISIFLLDDFYPAGDEHVLVYDVLGRKIPEAGIPIDVNTVVQNVETLYNISRAVKHIAVTDKYVTVSGAVKNPVTVNVPLGTPFKKLLEMAGGTMVRDFLLFDGGPMMGKTASMDSTVTKTTSGLLAIPAGTHPWLSKKINLHVQIIRARSACCQCRECTELCPRRLLGHALEPHRIMRAVANGISDVTALKTALICSECGLCEIACPMGLSPRAINVEIKKTMQQKGIKYDKTPALAQMKERAWRKFPAKKLLTRIGMDEYAANHAALMQTKIEVDEVTLPLKQHAGVPAYPTVQEGQKVEKGDIIGRIPEGKLGANLHASIGGIVARIGPDYITISNR